MAFRYQVYYLILFFGFVTISWNIFFAGLKMTKYQEVTHIFEEIRSSVSQGNISETELVYELCKTLTDANIAEPPKDAKDYEKSQRIATLTDWGYVNYVHKFCTKTLSTATSMSYQLHNNMTSTYCNCTANWRGWHITNYTELLNSNQSWSYALSPGGAWEPSGCIPRQQVAVIVPFRDRESHLQLFLQAIHPIMQRQKLAYRVFVVEQAAPFVFNKAAMMDIGFVRAQGLGRFDCFLFMDVDILPEDDRNLLVCADMPRHLGNSLSFFNYSTKYYTLIGGGTAFTAEQFVKVNGFSTEFYGWGGEDDDMYNRIKYADMTVLRYPKRIAKSHSITHERDTGNPYNEDAGKAYKYRPGVYGKLGLSSLVYSLQKVEERPLYTWIYAEVPEGPNFNKTKPSKSKIAR